jgi:GH15 family glucan-1,4-alpha-glucosidase
MENDCYRQIKEYAYIGISRSVALISLSGSIDWLCWPLFDSPFLFGSMLDSIMGGYWNITPKKDFTATRLYTN